MRVLTLNFAAVLMLLIASHTLSAADPPAAAGTDSTESTGVRPLSTESPPGDTTEKEGESGTKSAAPSPFDLPGIYSRQGELHRRAAFRMTQQQYVEAENDLLLAVAAMPHDAIGYYNLGCAQVRQGKLEEGLASIRKSIELGFRGRDQMANDEDLKPLRPHRDFAQLLEAASTPPLAHPPGWQYQVQPAIPENGELIVQESCTAFNPQLGLLVVSCQLDNAGKDRPIVKGYGEAGKLLEQWSAAGTVAGNAGDLYDNHDGDHSNMNFGAFPQLTRIEFSQEAKDRRLHNGVQVGMMFNGVTIGNSSTALVNGPFWRSQGRVTQTFPLAIQRLAIQYLNNHLYFYPEHRDHDAGHNGKPEGYGDLFPANTPYLIISQGSSGSDRVFMDAICATLAAFRPEVKKRLTESRMLMPTVQMIFRRCYKGIETDADYLSGVAHPTVFEGQNLDPVKMVTLAHDITLETLPPVVSIKVIEENLGVVGRDYFDSSPREVLFDTPAAIARIIKSSARDRRFVLSFEGSSSLCGKPLTYHTVVLRGDAEQIQIQPLNEVGSLVELIVPYHGRGPISPGHPLESNRVDIGFFVHDGTHYSAPAFLSLTTLDNELREYDEQGRIVTIDYTSPTHRDNYVDPLLDSRKDWRDEYHYTDEGALTGWTRIRGESREDFHHDGRLIVSRKPDGSPKELRSVQYNGVPTKDGSIQLQQITLEPQTR